MFSKKMLLSDLKNVISWLNLQGRCSSPHHHVAFGRHRHRTPLLFVGPSRDCLLKDIILCWPIMGRSRSCGCQSSLLENALRQCSSQHDRISKEDVHHLPAMWPLVCRTITGPHTKDHRLLNGIIDSIDDLRAYHGTKQNMQLPIKSVEHPLAPMLQPAQEELSAKYHTLVVLVAVVFPVNKPALAHYGPT